MRHVKLRETGGIAHGESAVIRDNDLAEAGSSSLPPSATTIEG